MHLLFYINVLNNIPSEVSLTTYIFSLPYLNQWQAMIGPPGGSAGEEFACNVGDPGLLPGPETSAREGIGYLLLYS